MHFTFPRKSGQFFPRAKASASALHGVRLCKIFRPPEVSLASPWDLQWVSGESRSSASRAITIRSLSGKREKSLAGNISIGWVWPGVLIVVRIHISRNRNHLCQQPNHTPLPALLLFQQSSEWAAGGGGRVFFSTRSWQPFRVFRRRAAQPSVKKPLMLNLQTRGNWK